MENVFLSNRWCSDCFTTFQTTLLNNVATLRMGTIVMVLVSE